MRNSIRLILLLFMTMPVFGQKGFPIKVDQTYFDGIRNSFNASSILKEGGAVRDEKLEIRSKVDQQYGSVINIQDTDYADRFDLIRNVSRFTEDLSWLYYNVSAGSTKTGVSKTCIVDNKPVKLDEVTVNGSHILSIRFNAGLMTPFVAGQRYLISFYVWSSHEQWFWIKAGASSFGHGIKWVPANQLTRVWATFQATTPALVDTMVDPSVPMGLGTGTDPYLIASGPGIVDSCFIGGVQIEGVPANYKDGIAHIGDSTIQHNQGGNDLQKDYRVIANRAISNVLGALLRVNVFNRGIGGERLDQIDARFNTDIGAIAANCREVHIQGGINDIGQGTRTLANMQASITSMVSKAIALGLEYKIYTCTPTNTIGNDPTKEQLRKQFNSWIKSNYGVRAIDISSVVEDPENPGFLRPEYWGDGVHYSAIGRMSVARFIASQSDKFSWIRKPSKYYPIYN